MCGSCGVANLAGHRHCVYCGAGIRQRGGAQVGGGTGLTLRNPLAKVAGLANQAILEAYLTFLLPFGLLGLVAAQLVFRTGDHHDLPGFGVFAILVAIGAVAVWAATVGRRMIPAEELRSQEATTDDSRFDGSGHALPKTLILVAGVVMLSVLLFRVVSGSDNTWDLGLWVASIAACGAYFLPAKSWRVSRRRRVELIERSRGFVARHWWDILPLLAILAIYCAITIPNLTAWRYAALGDEYLFYEHARDILDNGTTTPFSQEGVYEHHPVMNTVYKAVWMSIFGDGHFGWKMTGVASMALSMTGLYVLGNLLGGRCAAITAAGFLAASHYLFGLLNGGYNHLDALPVTIWTLAAFVIGVRRQDPRFLFLAGVGVGLGFYFHYSARIVGPVMLLAALVAVNPRDYLRLWPVIPGFLLTVWPTLLLAQEEILTKMLDQTAAGYSENIVGPIGERLLTNIKLNLAAFHFNTASHTYAGGPLLDPITGALAAIGVALAVGTLDRLSSKLCLIWVAVAFLATGLTSPYPTTAITRLFPMVPPLALLAGLAIPAGYALVAESMGRFSAKLVAIMITIGLVGLLGATLALNQYRALEGTHEVFHYTRDSLAVAASRSPHCDDQSDSTQFVGVHPESTLRKAIRSYDPDGVQPTAIPFSEFDIGQPLPGSACVIIPDNESRQARWVMAQLQERYPSGTFYTYTSPSMKSSVEYFHIPRS